MASIVGVLTISLPPSEAFRPEFDSGADPTLLSNPFAGIFDEVFCSKPSNPCHPPSVGPGDGFAAQLNGHAPPLGTPDPDSARRDSLSPYDLDDDPLKTTAGPEDATSPETTTTTTTTTTTRDPGKQPSDQPPPDSSNKRKRPRARQPNTKRQRRRCCEKTSDNDTAEARARREVNLEKNRLAATRCREKRKNWTARLEDRHRQLSAHNKLLRAELAGLHDAVYGLKELVLRHADCGFRPVDEYVAREAERVQAKARGQHVPSSTSPLPKP